MLMRMKIGAGGLAISISLACGGLIGLNGSAHSLTSELTRKALASEAIAIRARANVCSWNNVEWKDLSQAERWAWMALGWTQQIWDSDAPNARASTDSKAWIELSPNERYAAQSLGYNQYNWDFGKCGNR
jgi:hypothetical protein